jgi:sulfite reductase beta subunit-like hemoprotein
MSLKLSDAVLASLSERYGERLNSLDTSFVEIDIRNCGCSGDCGSNWMRS